VEREKVHVGPLRYCVHTKNTESSDKSCEPTKILRQDILKTLNQVIRFIRFMVSVNSPRLLRLILLFLVSTWHDIGAKGQRYELLSSHNDTHCQRPLA
jgi:hypothetical protein